MLKVHKYGVASLAMAGLLAAGTARPAFARDETRPPQDKVAMGEEEMKHLLTLMADKDGKVSEEAFMRYVQAEFRRLKKDEQGRVDVLEVSDPPARTVNFSAAGK